MTIIKRTTTIMATTALGGLLALGIANAQQGQGQGQERQSPNQPREQPGHMGGQQGQRNPMGQQGQKAEPKGTRMGSESETTKMSGTVTEIDRSKRTVTVRDTQGKDHKIDVPADAPNFDSLKKGDRVDATYTESVAVTLLPPGAPPPGREERMRSQRKMGGGMMGREVTARAEILGIDESKNTVDLKLPNNE